MEKLPTDIINLIVSYSEEICRKCKEEINDEYLTHYEIEVLEKKPDYEYKIPEKKPDDSDSDCDSSDDEFRYNPDDYNEITYKYCCDCFSTSLLYSKAYIVYGIQHSSKKEIYKILYDI